ncbi:hypothetical protein B0T16DRAFT_232547 [Cercophora newfieldiana]|uniref:F-box domain-containing protein n=1 Tax=Cercophora newfieldiana TaxID=92897 RepID=A0AA39XRL9_9PEZI|nr:hypothetical protein B0T16DRAFT_232547 [Cercophora newfieldiana]
MAKPTGREIPREIRSNIMDMLIEDAESGKCSLANCATVCQEWQTVFEAANFARIELTQERLRESEGILHPRRRLVKYIWLFIQETSCDCPFFHIGYCPSIAEEENLAINLVVHDTINLLSLQLSNWEPIGDLQLDISVHSNDQPVERVTPKLRTGSQPPIRLPGQQGPYVY